MRYIDVHTHMLDQKWLQMLKKKAGRAIPSSR